MSRQSPVNSYLKALRRTAYYHLRDRLGLTIRPFKLRLALTNRCNARCIMCSVWKRQDNAAPSLPGEITVDEIAALARNSRGFLAKVDRISLTGGEPTLRRDLVEVVRALTEGFPGRSLSLNTNGFATRKALEFVERSFELRDQLTVMLSLDAMGEQHNAVRGMKNDVFGAVMKTIEGLLAMRRPGRKFKMEINMVMTEVNSDQLLPVFNFCRERGLGFNPIYVTSGQLYQNQELAGDGALGLSEEARARLLRDAREILRLQPSLQIAEAVNLLKTGRRDFNCWAGKLMMLIEDNCDVFPNGGCPPEFALGNLRAFDFDLERLLASPGARAILGRVSDCRSCQIPCEYITTLTHPESLTGYRKCRSLARETGTAEY